MGTLREIFVRGDVPASCRCQWSAWPQARGGVRASGAAHGHDQESNEADAQGGKKDVPPLDEVIEVSLTPAGDGTRVTIQAAGIPLDKVQFFGVGWQVHAEDLGGHLAGQAPVDDKERWDELLPASQELAAALG